MTLEGLVGWGIWTLQQVGWQAKEWWSSWMMRAGAWVRRWSWVWLRKGKGMLKNSPEEGKWIYRQKSHS